MSCRGCGELLSPAEIEDDLDYCGECDPDQEVKTGDGFVRA